MVSLFNPYAIGLEMTTNTLESINKAYQKDTNHQYEPVVIDIGAVTTHRTTISESDVHEFAGLSGDYNPLHTNDNYAENDGPFNGPIAHGVLVMGAISSALAKFEGDIVIDQMDELDFIDPVYTGDEIVARCEISEVDERKAVVKSTVTKNDNESIVLKGTIDIFNAEGIDLD